MPVALWSRLKPWPLVTLASFCLGPAVGGLTVPGLLTGVFMAMIVGLPCDSYRRCGRMSTAFSWLLLPWFVAWFGDATGKSVVDPDSLWFIPWMPREAHLLAMLGFPAGLALCACVEWVENRTRTQPTLLPMKCLGVVLAVWLIPAMFDKLVPTWWKNGAFLFPALGLLLGWLVVRVARTLLNDNPARRRIREVQSSKMFKFR